MAPLFFLNALLGISLSAVVLRAAPWRPENRWCALAGFVDAGIAIGLGIVYVNGGGFVDPVAVRICAVGGILISYPVLQFTHVFPFGNRPSRLVSGGALAATAVALALSLHPATRVPFSRVSSWLFFLPLFGLSLLGLWRNSRRLRQQGLDATGVWLIGFAALGRWGLELVTFVVVRPLWPAAFVPLGIFDHSVAVLASYVLINYAMLRHRLFRVRGVLAESALWGLGAALMLGVVALVVSLVQSHIHSPPLARVALVGVAALPGAVLLLLRRYRGRIEAVLLGSLDPRRAQRHGTLEQAVSDSAPLVEPGPLVALTVAALANVTSGGSVKFLAARGLRELGAGTPFLNEDLPEALVVALGGHNLPFLHHPLPPGLSDAEVALFADGAELLVPVRVAGRLYGALMVWGGTLDRGTLLTAVALADNLAGKLERCSLFQARLQLSSELEGARRLAALGSFAAAVAHDIRTPLTSVQLNVQMLRQKASLPAADMECFDIALDEIRRLDQHVSEILDFAKPIRLHAAPVELRELVEEVGRRLEPVLAGRELTLEQRHASPLPLVQGDPQRLRQALMNLVDNAAVASPLGGAIVIATRSGPADMVVVEVSDRGKGIAPAHLPKIFEPFFTTRAGGTGLGLAIVQKVIKAHGGQIEVRSRPGEGATFTVLLPAISPANLPSRDRASANV